ncbi:phenoloxidase 1 isoform X2 [Agrilus planipennis]|nr:phenoloxidase 1 isoform X2 [Agrilus planipennis]
MAQTANKKQNLLLLYDRPLEPIFVSKEAGKKKSIFDVPSTYLTERYKPIGIDIANRFGEEADERIPVKEIRLPDLGPILDLKRDENFTLFLPKHRTLAGRLIDIFLGMRTVEDFISCAVYARDRVNPLLFNYALSVAILHRPDTRNLDVPSLITTFPEKYVDSKVFTKAREEMTIVSEGSREPIIIPKDYTASDLEHEHRVAYFREDIGLNLHHWHWHLVYPFEAAREVVNKNRRGELFYYMHQQVVARYNIERLCNKLNRVERLIKWREPIPEGYFPKLDSIVASRAWPARVANQRLSNLSRDQDQIHADIDTLERWRDRIYEAIHQGFAQDDRNNRIELTETEGIDILGNIVESSILSPNRDYYGDLHNMGHIFLSFIHDPDHRNLEPAGVMGDSATAMRDPVFYRWHAFVDDMFQEHKATLPRYSVQQLTFDGVTVSDVSVSSQNSTPNVLNTFWQQSDVDLSRGMDFQPRGSVFARFTHLQHQPFRYTVTVDNNGAQRQGTCRIFLAPKFDERGNPWLFRDQKGLFIELDRFVVNLRQGKNTITRNSTESSVTIPFERTFRNLDWDRPADQASLEQFNFCGCGWPQHLLIPKGTTDGYACELFVMISNYQDDRVAQDISGVCNDAMSYCGIKDRLYPDRKSMGFPFDRMPRDGVDTLRKFLTPNMRVQDVQIRFQDRTLRPRAKN